MENIIITYKTVLLFLGGIITIGGAITVITRWFSPFTNLKKEVQSKADTSRMEQLEARLEKVEKYQSNDHEKIQRIEMGNEHICKCILAITDHELTGNSVDKLRKAKDEMQNYLITR